MNPIKTFLLCVSVAATLAGCASVSDCASDWYAIGARDGRLGATPQADYYAAQCTGAIDRARYESGWQAGQAERPLPLW